MLFKSTLGERVCQGRKAADMKDIIFFVFCIANSNIIRIFAA